MSCGVCFVGVGRIFRSPMAGPVFRARVERAAPDGVGEVDGAGTAGRRVGEGAGRRTAAVLAGHGHGTAHGAHRFEAFCFVRLDTVRPFGGWARRRLTPTERDARTVCLLRP